MIPFEKRVDLGDQAHEVLGAVGPPAQAFLAYRAVEAFNVGLFVLLLRAGNAMPVAIIQGLLGTRPFELGPPIGVQDLNMSRKAPGPGGL